MKERPDHQQPEHQQASRLSSWSLLLLPLCVALGVVFGIVTDNVPFGLILGVSTGTALGVGVGSALRERERD
jgi:hypothetical protein